MKKLTLIFLTLILNFSYVFAQTTKKEIVMDGDESLETVFPLKNGLVVVKGPSVTKSKTYEIYVYSKNLELKNEFQVEDKATTTVSDFLVTPSEKYLYYISPKYMSKPAFILRMDSSGKKEELYKGNFSTSEPFFVDDNYYYNASIDNPFKGGSITRIGKDGLKTFNFSFPAVREEKKSIGWFYAFNKDNEIYYASKTFYSDHNYVLDFIAVNYSGEVIRKFKVECPLPGKFILPVNNSITKYVYFDKESNFFYITSLWGPKDYNGHNYDNKGFFIAKFDLNGKQIWQKEYDFPAQITEDKRMRPMVDPAFKAINIAILPNESLKFQFKYLYTVDNFIINSVGDVQSYYRYELNDQFLQPQQAYSKCYLPSADSKNNDYVKETSITPKSSYYIFYQNNFDYLVEEKKKEDRIVLYCFPKKK